MRMRFADFTLTNLIEADMMNTAFIDEAPITMNRILTSPNIRR